MTVPYALTPLAEADLDEIASYIAADNAAGAERFIHEAYQAFAKLAEQPNLGHRRPDLTAAGAVLAGDAALPHHLPRNTAAPGPKGAQRLSGPGRAARMRGGR